MHTDNPLFESYLSAALSGRQADALLLLSERLDAGLHPRVLLRSVVQPAQHRVGELWEANEISSAEEHLATAVAQVAAAQLFSKCAPCSPNGFSVLVACVEGDQHAFPARLAADAFALAGFAVHLASLGTSTADLCQLVRERRPHVVGLSATLHHHLPTLRASLAAVRQVLPSALLLAGGNAACPSLRDEDPGLLVACGSAEALVDTVLSRLRHPQAEAAR